MVFAFSHIPMWLLCCKDCSLIAINAFQKKILESFIKKLGDDVLEIPYSIKYWDGKYDLYFK